MSDIEVITDLTAIETGGVAFAGTDWTKTSGGSGWTGYMLARKFALTPFDDQSLRDAMASLLYRHRISLASFANRRMGQTPELAIEYRPSTVAVDVVNDPFSTDFGTPDWDSTLWQAFNSGAPTVSGGALNFTGLTASRGLRSVISYDFTDREFSCKVPVLQSDANCASGYLLATSDGLTMYWSMDEYNGNLRCFSQGASVFTTPYNAVNHLYKMIRFYRGKAQFWTSPDGTPGSWTMVHETGALTQPITALFVYLRPFVNSGSKNFQFDDAKIVTYAQNDRYMITEGNSVVAYPSDVPALDDERRIQVFDTGGGVYQAYYKIRPGGVGSESTMHTSVISSATLQTYFPLFAKGEIYTEGGILRDLQYETPTGPFRSMNYKSYVIVQPVTRSVRLRWGQPLPPPADDILFVEFATPTGAGVVRKFPSPKEGTVRLTELLTDGNTGDSIFDIRVNGVTVIEGMALGAGNGSSENEFEVEVGQQIEVICTDLGDITGDTMFLRMVI